MLHVAPANNSAENARYYYYAVPVFSLAPNGARLKPCQHARHCNCRPKDSRDSAEVVGDLAKSWRELESERQCGSLAMLADAQMAVTTAVCPLPHGRRARPSLGHIDGVSELGCIAFNVAS